MPRPGQERPQQDRERRSYGAYRGREDEDEDQRERYRYADESPGYRDRDREPPRGSPSDRDRYGRLVGGQQREWPSSFDADRRHVRGARYEDERSGSDSREHESRRPHRLDSMFVNERDLRDLRGETPPGP